MCVCVCVCVCVCMCFRLLLLWFACLAQSNKNPLSQLLSGKRFV